MNDRLALKLASSICEQYQIAYAPKAFPNVDQILQHWRQTPTKSTRLLVRLTINELDILADLPTSARVAQWVYSIAHDVGGLTWTASSMIPLEDRWRAAIDRLLATAG